MRISSKGRYALKLAADVAQYEKLGPVSLREISERTGLSVKYLEQLAGVLVRGNVLQSKRGARGGYVLARDAHEISAGEVLRLSEGSTAPVACLDEDAGLCPHRSECGTIGFWTGLDQAIEGYVDSVSLADMGTNV